MVADPVSVEQQIGSKSDKDETNRPTAEMFQTPIQVSEESNNTNSGKKSRYPTPTGNEYDVIDKIAAELPNVIDEESKPKRLWFCEIIL